MTLSRRHALVTGALAATGFAALATSRADAQPAAPSGPNKRARREAPGLPGKDYRPVVTPNGATLPFSVRDGVKIFHLVAEEVRHEFCQGLEAICWGFNGRVHGPTIEAVEGDHVRIYVTNHLPAPTTVHWHGIYLPNGMDGVGGLTQRVIQPGETFRYEFTLRQFGTFMYHSHHDEMTQMSLGLMGMIVVHPRKPTAADVVDRDFVLMLSEWSILPGASRPNTIAMSDFNVLTMNAKAFPGTAPLVCKRGDRVRVRLGNLSAMDHHSIHLHGFSFRVTATDGGVVPQEARFPETTVLVPTGSTRDFVFVADEDGDWPLHCHMTHHAMNQMGHGMPPSIGLVPGDLDENVQKLVSGYMTMGQYGMGDMAEMQMPSPKNSIPMLGGPARYGAITMGGMFTIVKVRAERFAEGVDPGWYEPPPGTLADVASPELLALDGVVVPPRPAPLRAPTATSTPTASPAASSPSPSPASSSRGAHAHDHGKAGAK
jgi:hypothetical protein